MRHTRPLGFALILGSLLVSALAAPVAAATTRYVDDDGRGSPSGCNGTRAIADTIQEAVDVSSAGDSVVVCPGLYIGRVVVDVPNLRLRGLVKGEARIRSGRFHPSGEALIDVVDAPGARISALSLSALTTGTCAPVAAMIGLTMSPGAIVRENWMNINGTAGLGSCGYEAGIRVWDGSDGAQVLWNTVIDFRERGIWATDSEDVMIRGNTVNYFHASYGHTNQGGAGIVLGSLAPGVRVLENTVAGLSTTGSSTPWFQNGIYLEQSTASVRGNRLRNMANAITFEFASGARMVNNVATVGIGIGGRIVATNEAEVFGNRFNGLSTSFAVSSGAGNDIHDNDFRGNSDCVDLTTGSGTAGTANFWTDNLGPDDTPDGICEAP